MTFRIQALDPGRFAALFDLPDAALAGHLAVRVVADSSPGFPCRVSLADSEVGEELLLVNHVHQPLASPYRAAHAVFVRRNVAQAHPRPAEVPAMFRTRQLSLRGFDTNAMLLQAELIQGAALGATLDAMFAEAPGVAFVDIHFAGPGCYAAKAVRA